MPKLIEQLRHWASKLKEPGENTYAELDEFLYKLIPFYLKLNDDSRQKIRQSVGDSTEFADGLRNFAERAAISLHRSTSGDRYADVVPRNDVPIVARDTNQIFGLGIGALAIEDCVDYRESLTALAELCIRGEQAGVKPHRFLRQYACAFSEKSVGGYGNEFRPYSSIVRGFRKKPVPGPALDEPIILGQQLADAHEADKRHSQSGATDTSPLPQTTYDFWKGEHSLVHLAPNPLDLQIRDVCREYRRSNADKRSEIRRSCTMDQFYTLMTFAKRSAVFAIHEAKTELIADGLTGIAMIELERIDMRDIRVPMGLLYHAAKQVGVNADKMFRIASTLADPEVAKEFDFFANHTRKFQLRSWLYEEVETPAGPGFIGRDTEEFKPTIDLKSAIMDISGLVLDDYQPSSIEVAKELPEVWFGENQGIDSKRMFSGIRGAASIHARLRPDKHPELNSQNLMVFLAETASESDAQSLFRMAEDNASSRYGQLVLARSRLLCLVIGRSTMADDDDYETIESLKRFTHDLSAILERRAGIERAK